jgi:hypothetical protein
MWKYLAIFVVIFGLAVYVARQDERTAQESAQKAEHLARSAVSAKSDAQHTQQNVPDPERHTPSWFGFFRWPNGTTTWAIVLTLLAIAEQTRETAKAAKATQRAAEATDKSALAAEKSAKAAADNIELVINKERARLRVEIGEMKIDSSINSIPVVITYSVFCDGPTPAFITAASATVDATESSDVSVDRMAQLRITFPMHGIPPVFHPNIEGLVLRALLFQVIPEGDVRDLINNRSVFIHFHGIIEYTDVFDRQRYTRFRYLWDVQDRPLYGGPVGNWTKYGPKEDNEAT